MQLFSNKITPAAFFKLAAPAVGSMIFMALYTIVDGIFVSRLVGTDALASINIMMPLINLTFGVAIMIAAGGSAVVGLMLGQKREADACSAFSALLAAGLLIGFLMALPLALFQRQFVRLLGATPALYGYCYTYGFLLSLSIPVAIVKSLLEYFTRTDGNASFSMWMSVIGGITNILLDWLFIGPMGMGIAGAALGTVAGYGVSLLMGLGYFLRKRSGLRFSKPRLRAGTLLKVFSNGSSEMVTELSTGVTTLLFNLVTLRWMGENGIAAISIILYVHFLLNSVYLGFICGVAPAISYNHGAGDHPQLRRIVRYSRIFLLASSGMVFFFCIFFTPVLVGVFTPASSPVFPVASHGLRLFAPTFLFIGVNVFASGLFTAFGNGGISALLSFLRAFLFPIPGVLLLPYLLEADGVWVATPAAELLTLGFSLWFLWYFRHRYHYGRES